MARDAQQVMWFIQAPQNALAARQLRLTIPIHDKVAVDHHRGDFRNRFGFRVLHPPETTRRAQLQREKAWRLG